jgi:hypothetical protein
MRERMDKPPCGMAWDVSRPNKDDVVSIHANIGLQSMLTILILNASVLTQRKACPAPFFFLLCSASSEEPNLQYGETRQFAAAASASGHHWMDMMWSTSLPTTDAEKARSLVLYCTLPGGLWQDDDGPSYKAADPVDGLDP